MPTRREFIGTGLSAVAIGLLRRSSYGLFPHPNSAGPLSASRPIITLPAGSPSVLVQDMPFASGWFGDPWPQTQIPFHVQENDFPGGQPPAPQEEVEIAIVGGGLSGLATAYLLRHRKPVIFELQDRFGGVSKGEEWLGTSFSLGGAYFIAPDQGTFLEDLYRELGLHHVKRLSLGDDGVELNNVILDDFWSGAGLPPDQMQAFQRYAEIVAYFGENYPEIPLPEGKDNQWILDLDQKSLKQDLEDRMLMPIPPLLAAGIQAYCYSSFAAGWQDISAAAGWNFIAAEEFGRWVCPGGNAYVADVLWEKLVKSYTHANTNFLDRLRPNTIVVDVRLAANDKVQVTYRTSNGEVRSLLARRVVMANSKHIAKYMIHDLATIDPVKLMTMQQVVTNAYIVANVLIDAEIPANRYDVFLLDDGRFPMTEADLEANAPVVDMLTGHYARRQPSQRSVLTLYWPLPWGHGVFTIIDAEAAWQTYSSKLVPQIERMLTILNVPRSAVQQVRMARWGHAMPTASPGFIASGMYQQIRRPIQDRIYFVNQDNWVLPAFETCLLEAKTYAAQIDASLG